VTGAVRLRGGRDRRQLLAGYLADRIGPRALVALAGVVLIVISLLSRAGGSTRPPPSSRS
jgi:hypothetical protein